MKERLLYLEERLAIVRRRLDQGSCKFQDAMPQDLQIEFHRYIMGMLTVLMGDPFGKERVDDS
jgi:hypothetical protein